jgi:hypothetical protein
LFGKRATEDVNAAIMEEMKGNERYYICEKKISMRLERMIAAID